MSPHYRLILNSGISSHRLILNSGISPHYRLVLNSGISPHYRLVLNSGISPHRLILNSGISPHYRLILNSGISPHRLIWFHVVYRHEDGSVKFWDVSSLSFNLLYTISTAQLFQSDFDDGPPPEDDEDEDWPPFKKVGKFDSFTDDPRFVIQKLLLCPVSLTLVVGGSGGQLIIYDISPNAVLQDKAEVNYVDSPYRKIHFFTFFSA